MAFWAQVGGGGTNGGVPGEVAPETWAREPSATPTTTSASGLAKSSLLAEPGTRGAAERQPAPPTRWPLLAPPLPVEAEEDESVMTEDAEVWVRALAGTERSKGDRFQSRRSIGEAESVPWAAATTAVTGPSSTSGSAATSGTSEALLRREGVRGVAADDPPSAALAVGRLRIPFTGRCGGGPWGGLTADTKTADEVKTLAAGS
mmetsp:Transcript_82953/g.177803  ORF Transcript_82953/g.177803 Transcript_82953/m.177803 type:complete len:204 (+) Transcript_82953:797-1408(+)